ncbi:MAG TPA: TlpA disulfide reductase family protein [Egibacteraceae bacterium]|nr:TlpA disulfide reductase family protein [Egibacteraceae bacterium]
MSGSDRGADAPTAEAESEGASAAAWRTAAIAGAAAIALLVAVVLLVAERSADGIPAGAEPLPGATPGLLGERPRPDDARPLPPVVLDGFADGDQVDVLAYRGRPLVVNFWASWCGPCVEEMPDFEQVGTELAGQVAMLGVNVRDAPGQAQRFAEEAGVTYDLAVDADRELEIGVGVFGLPTTLFVDADGTIVLHHTGPLNAEQLRGLIAERLGASAADRPA